MSRSNPKFGPGYVHLVSPEQAIEDNITGNAFLMLGWAHEFCRRRKRDVLTTKEFHMSGVAIDSRTIRKYLSSLHAAEHIEKASRGHWRVSSLGQVGYKQVPGANHATRNAPSTQPLKTVPGTPYVPLNEIIPEPSGSALLNQKDLSQRLKANEPPPPTPAIAPEPIAIEVLPAPQPVACDETMSAPEPVAIADVKTQVARQAGSGEKQGSSMADTFLSMGVFASGKSLEDLLAMQDVDLDDLDTEAILAQDRQEAAWLGAHRVPAHKAPGRAVDALLHTSPAPAGTQVSTAPPVPQTTQRLPTSVIRHTLGQMAEAIPEFVFGEKEVNALRKWPVTEAQLVNLKNAAVARKRQGKLTGGIGAYLYGAVRRASLGLLPARRGAGVHLASAWDFQAGPLA